MEDIQRLQETLSKIACYDDFFEVRRQLQRSMQADLFQELWSLAIQQPGDGSAGMAGCMLAELQPNSDRNLEDLLSAVHASALDASNRIVPFYLVAEYGKHAVLKACADFINKLPQEGPRSRVDAIRYWASHPASDLCKQFHDWEAREMYGVPDA